MASHQVRISTTPAIKIIFLAHFPILLCNEACLKVKHYCAHKKVFYGGVYYHLSSTDKTNRQFLNENEKIENEIDMT